MSDHEKSEVAIEALTDADLESVSGGLQEVTNSGSGTCYSSVSNPCENSGSGTCRPDSLS
jgi:hypothetical protein